MGGCMYKEALPTYDWDSDSSDGLRVLEPSAPYTRTRAACHECYYQAKVLCCWRGERGYDDDLSVSDMDESTVRHLGDWVGSVVGARSPCRRRPSPVPSPCVSPRARLRHPPPALAARRPSWQADGLTRRSPRSPQGPASPPAAAGARAHSPPVAMVSNWHDNARAVTASQLMALWAENPRLHVEYHPIDPPYPPEADLPVRQPAHSRDKLYNFERHPRPLTCPTQLAALQHFLERCPDAFPQTVFGCDPRAPPLVPPAEPPPPQPDAAADAGTDLIQAFHASPRADSPDAAALAKRYSIVSAGDVIVGCNAASQPA